MFLVLILTLLLFGLTSTVRAQGDYVYVYPNSTLLNYSDGAGNTGPSWGQQDPYISSWADGNTTCGGGVRWANAADAWVELDFSGSQLWIHFLGDSAGGNVSITIDYPPAATFNTTYGGGSYSDCFTKTYSSDSLPDGPHKVKVQSSTGYLYFHGFEYIPTVSSSSSSLTPAVVETSSSITTTPSYPPESQPAESKGGSSDVGPIAGGVIGGIIFGCLIAVAVGTFILRRRRRPESYALDMNARAVDGSLDSQPPNSAGNTLSNPFTYQQSSQLDLPLIAYPQAYPSSSPATAQSPTIPPAKPQPWSPRQLPSPPPSAVSATRTSELVAGRPMSSSQLDVVRSLVDRRVPDEVISSMIEVMVAGQAIPNATEELDHHQAALSIESPPQYSADTRWP